MKNKTVWSVLGIIIMTIFIVVMLTGCGKEENTIQNNANDSEEEEKMPEFDGENPIVIIEMEDGGTIKLELYPAIAPITVANFVKLASEGFYDGLIFHRTIPGFMIQGGCPDGNGTGGPGSYIKGEFSANGVDNNISHKRGVISMARANPYDSAGSQFFIVETDSEFLDKNYAGFGKVLEGMDVVDAIANLEVVTRVQGAVGQDRPVDPPVIKSITVEVSE